MIISFIERCLRGECEPHHIDDYVDMWHDQYYEADFVSLSEFLGMTEEEYSTWLKKPNYVEEILKNRKK